MKPRSNTTYRWAIIGAGPAGLTSAGLLLDAGVPKNDILIIDPTFQVGDFGQHWGEVYSNTSITDFMNFLTGVNSFCFPTHSRSFAIESKPPEGYCQLKHVTEVLLWVTHHFLEHISHVQGHVNHLATHNGAWEIHVNNQTPVSAKNVILATGATPQSLSHPNINSISLYDALNPSKLQHHINHDNSIAVFGSSHSSMIIMKNLLDLGIKRITNFYRSPNRYAVKMDHWTLYDNTGLKAGTATWARQHISKQLDPRITRHFSDEATIQAYLSQCDKAIYPVGFQARIPTTEAVNAHHYDTRTGIIAPGLFGAGIAFPRLVTDPLGNQEFNVGLLKFMRDIRSTLSIWQQYSL